MHMQIRDKGATLPFAAAGGGERSRVEQSPRSPHRPPPLEPRDLPRPRGTHGTLTAARAAHRLRTFPPRKARWEGTASPAHPGSGGGRGVVVAGARRWLPGHAGPPRPAPLVAVRGRRAPGSLSGAMAEVRRGCLPSSPTGGGCGLGWLVA